MQPEQPKTLNHIFVHSVEQYRREALLAHTHQGALRQFSTEEFKDAVYALSGFLRSSGLEPGDHVAILAENRPEWHIADFAILMSRMVSVPVYPTLSETQLRYLLQHGECRAVVVSRKEQWQKIAAMRRELPHLRCVIAMDEWTGQPTDVAPLPRIFRETKVGREAAERAHEEALAVDPDSPATIVYTSGTTGTPKGVVLTHANITFNLWHGLRRLQFERVPQALSVLPLSHVFERLLCYGYFLLGIPIAYGDPYQLAEHFVRYRPAALGCVPRMLEKIQEAVTAQIQTMPRWRQNIAGWLLDVGREHIGERVHARRATARSRAFYPLADLLVYRKIRRRLGGRVQGMIVGGGRLDASVQEFFLAAGFRVVQGYGLTETSPVVSLDPPDEVKPGAVGKPLDQIEVSFAEDGEIMTRGPHVMKGYFKDAEGTAMALRGGWLLTGDLGRMDEHGYLQITGRKKEILVTAGGKNISPVMIESQLCRSSLIQEAFVVGDGRKFVSALLVPDRSKLMKAARARSIPCDEAGHWMNSAAVADLLWSEIHIHQAEFSEHEKIKRFRLLDETVLTDQELFTPTQKVRRGVLERKYQSLIDEMYRA